MNVQVEVVEVDDDDDFVYVLDEVLALDNDIADDKPVSVLDEVDDELEVIDVLDEKLGDIIFDETDEQVGHLVLVEA